MLVLLDTRLCYDKNVIFLSSPNIKPSGNKVTAGIYRERRISESRIKLLKDL